MSETPFDREQYEIDDARGLATGGEIRDPQPLLIGEHNCHLCGHRPDATPLNVTVNVHGSVTSTEEIERIVRDIIRRMTQRRPPSGG